MKNRNLLSVAWLAGFAVFFATPGVRAQSQTAPPSKDVLVEEIVARVNNQIITLSDYQKAAQGLGKRSGRIARVARRKSCRRR